MSRSTLDVSPHGRFAHRPFAPWTWGEMSIDPLPWKRFDSCKSQAYLPNWRARALSLGLPSMNSEHEIQQHRTTRQHYTIILIFSALRKLKQLRQTNNYFWSASIDKLVLSWPKSSATLHGGCFNHVHGAKCLGQITHAAKCLVRGKTSVDVSPHFQGANHLWGEMSSVGQNIRQANCPWGETSMRRTVHGMKSL